MSVVLTSSLPLSFKWLQRNKGCEELQFHTCETYGSYPSEDNTFVKLSTTSCPCFVEWWRTAANPGNRHSGLARKINSLKLHSKTQNPILACLQTQIESYYSCRINPETTKKCFTSYTVLSYTVETRNTHTVCLLMMEETQKSIIFFCLS